MCCVAKTLNLHLFPSVSHRRTYVHLVFTSSRMKRNIYYLLPIGIHIYEKKTMFTKNTQRASPISITLRKTPSRRLISLSLSLFPLYVTHFINL